MADLPVRLDESRSAVLAKGDDLVLTSGIVATDPEKHAMPRIPDSVILSLDMRSLSAKTPGGMGALLRAAMRQGERERKVRFEPDEEMRVEPAPCASGLVPGLSQAMRRAGREPLVMASGGGHDAAVFAGAGIAAATDVVCNRNGTRNPDEAVELPDFLAATDIAAALPVETP